jgi:1-acylglycerone phosphate reductase
MFYLTNLSRNAFQITGGSPEILINNTGGGYNMPVADIEISKAKALFDLNV